VRILLLSNLYPPYVEGGAEILAGNIAAGLERRGHEVMVLTSTYGLSRSGQRNGSHKRHQPEKISSSSTPSSLQWRILQYIPTAHFDRQGSLWSQIKKLLNYYRRYHNAANAQKLREVIATTSPDILYIWEITGIGINSLLNVLPELKIPIVFHMGNYWLLYAHSPETEQSRLRIRWLKQLLIGSVPELTWTSMIAVSETVKQEYTRAGFDPERIEVIYNGIDPRCLTLPRSTCNEEKSCQLLYVGRIRVEKGILVILKALHLLMHYLNDATLYSAEQHLDVPPLRLHIFGDGDQTYVSELKIFLREKGLEELVIFHGKIPQDELIEYYDHSQIMLVPSLWQEPFGLVVAEAMARGLPVIASNVGGPSEIITHERNGLLVEAGDERALAKAISQLIKDPDKRQRLGEAARTTVQERFVLEETVSRVEQHLRRAMNCETC
jgi:glycogen synthase